MARIRLAPLVVVAPLALLPVASAQSPAGPSAPLQTLSGQVMTAHDDTLVIATETGEEKAFVMEANVEIPTEASPGHRVTVTYRSSEGPPARAVGVRVDEEGLRPPQDEDEQLPRAASVLPLVALSGIVALSGSLALRAAARTAR
jgi:hypothetical protein